MNEKLCYVRGSWAYFTTQDLNEQWGDDWSDAPYEHNAGEPYDSRDGDSKKWEITCVAFKANLDAPSDTFLNSPFSVEDINSGAIAWLRSPRYEEKKISIQAGVSIQEFKALIEQAGGEVYFKA